MAKNINTIIMLYLVVSLFVHSKAEIDVTTVEAPSPSPVPAPSPSPSPSPAPSPSPTPAPAPTPTTSNQTSDTPATPVPTPPTPTTPATPDPSHGTTEGSLKPEECSPRCDYRCSKTHHKKPCLFFCKKCCAECLCVPPGTYGNKEVCPCYDNWKTKRGTPKCP
ncbi:uncharacterized protein [Cicer arietinum]|uniref:Gibberellin-regulated protein 14-like n=1 Tax=Cicer arietinum TaxID=3827 RepID=A0A1S2Z2I6_CICAR|nr:gibberellin-regulated protein 14-like [Cicer arietinum]